MSKLNRRIREEQVEKHADEFIALAKDQGISDYKISNMKPEELYHFIDKAVQKQSDDFLEYVLYQVGEAEDYFHHVFAQIRAHIAQIIDEASQEDAYLSEPSIEEEWSQSEREQEQREQDKLYAQMRALAG